MEFKPQAKLKITNEAILAPNRTETGRIETDRTPTKFGVATQATKISSRSHSRRRRPISVLRITIWGMKLRRKGEHHSFGSGTFRSVM
jgi:hypothetical protein